MAQSAAPTALQIKKWERKFFREYVRENPYFGLMGSSEDSIIQVKQQGGKGKGDNITISLLNALTGAGRTGSQTLDGYEEDLSLRSQSIIIDLLRHAVLVPTMSEIRSAIDLRNAGRSALKTWIMDKTKFELLNGMRSIDGTLYADATTAAKNTWHDNNSDRAQYGALKSNHTAGDHAASLTNLDNAADKLSGALVKLVKRMAAEAAPKIRPTRVAKGGEEWFVLYAPPRAFRDLSEDAAITTAQRDAMARGEGNPLFAGGDIVYGGVIIKEDRDAGYLVDVGAGGTVDVAQCVLLGAQALSIVWGKRTFTVEETKDYKDKKGLAIGEIRGVEKLRFGTGTNDTDTPKDHGILTLFVAAEPDA